MEQDFIWENTLDGRYVCKVKRLFTVPRKGALTIIDQQKDNKVIFETLVHLSYDALFGPDVADVASWEDRILDFIDNEYTE